MMNEKLNIETDTQNQDLLSKSDFEPVVIPPINTVENIDCMEMLRKCPPKHFDLAIVDPPYGIGFDGEIESMVRPGNIVNGWNVKLSGYKKKNWDASPPPQEYFEELFRVSRKQIIWGGHLFGLPITRGWIFWDKLIPDGWSLGSGELAWTNRTNSIAKFTYRWHGMLKGKNGNQREDRIHPTQKPVALYSWLLKKYAAAGDLILDTHVGSGSSIVACIEGGFKYYGCEIDKEYYDATMKRIGRAFRRYELFENEAV